MNKKTIEALIKIIEKCLFKEELAALSLYCSHVKQERYIVALIAKHIWNSKNSDLLPCLLEVKKVDLVMKGIKLEAKYHFEFDILEQLEEQREKFNSESKKYSDEMEYRVDNNITAYEPLGISVVKDILKKQPNIFLWIVPCREYPECAEQPFIHTLDRNIVFSIYERETKCFLKNYKLQNSCIAMDVEQKAKKFIEDECGIQQSSMHSKVIQVKNDYFSTKYVFVFYDLSSK